MWNGCSIWYPNSNKSQYVRDEREREKKIDTDRERQKMCTQCERGDSWTSAFVGRSAIDGWSCSVEFAGSWKQNQVESLCVFRSFPCRPVFILTLSRSRLRTFQHHNRMIWFVHYFLFCHVVCSKEKRIQWNWLCTFQNRTHNLFLQWFSPCTEPKSNSR